MNGQTEAGFKFIKENGKLEEIKRQKGPYSVDQWNMDQIEVKVDSNYFIRVIFKKSIKSLSLKKLIWIFNKISLLLSLLYQQRQNPIIQQYQSIQLSSRRIIAVNSYISNFY